MDSIIEAARDAAQRGDKSKATDLLKQALENNPNNIDALLVLASLADENTQKRKVLNRVLSLDPANKEARQMSLEMDRAEIQASRSQIVTAPVSPAQTVPDDLLKKTQTFRLPQMGLILLFVFSTISCCGTIWFAAINNMSVGFAFLGMALLLALTALTASSKVEVNETGIQTSSIIRSAEIKWNEIASIQTNPWKGILELRSDIGDVVNISTQIRGYRDILDILRFKRPDLFPQASSVPATNAATAFPTSSLISTASQQPVSEPVAPPPTFSSNVKKEVQPVASSEVKESSPTAQNPIEKKERKLTFALPLFSRLFMYAFPLFFGAIGLLIAFANLLYSLPFLALALILGFVAVAFSPKIEITESGICSYSMFDSPEAQWSEIVQMKSNPLKRRLELIKANGESINVSTQVSGYPRIVEIIRQKRPDLFKLESQSIPLSALGTAGGIGVTSQEPSFRGIKTFKKNTFGQYGVILLMIPLCLLGVWLLFTNNDKFIGVGIGAVGVFFMVMSLFSVHQLRVEPNKISTESFFTQKEYTANQIKAIEMKTVRSRHGVATNLVSIQLVDGGTVSTAGFPEGDEVIYGILHEWWETYRNR